MTPSTPSPDPLRETFQRDGYVAMPGFLSPTELSDLWAHLNHFLKNTLSTLPKEHVFYEDKSDTSTLKQIQQMFLYDPYFQGLMFGSRFEEIAARFLGAPVVGKNLQYFDKPPGVGQPTPPHQDGFYFKLAPNEAVTMWLALDEVNEENGCVRYVPGSHHVGLLAHQRSQTLGFSQELIDYDLFKKREIPMPAHPGDLLVHHALTLHRADSNRSRTHHRRALGFIYYSANAREDREAHDAYQAKLAMEMATSGKI